MNNTIEDICHLSSDRNKAYFYRLMQVLAVRGLMVSISTDKKCILVL